MRRRTRHAAFVLAWLLCSAGTSYAQAPVCNHQWVYNGLPYFLPLSVTCGANTPPYTNFTVMATEDYNGYVFPYQGNDTKLHRLEGNIAAVSIELSEAGLGEIERAASHIEVQGARDSECAQRMINPRQRAGTTPTTNPKMEHSTQ